MTDASSPLVLDSLQRRMKALESLYEQAVTTMDLEHVNHFEREGVLPIAFSLFHYLNMHDASFMMITGVAPIWNADWQARVQMTIDDHGKHKTVDEMIHQRIGDYDAYIEYQRAVFARTARAPRVDRRERARPGRDPAPVPAADRVDVQRASGRSAGHHRARRVRVLDLPARPAPHGRDRARARPRRPQRHDQLTLDAVP